MKCKYCRVEVEMREKHKDFCPTIDDSCLPAWREGNLDGFMGKAPSKKSVPAYMLGYIIGVEAKQRLRLTQLKFDEVSPNCWAV